ncbi:MAG: ABC transporter permease [Desulfohalobiaceae bacterium]
MRQGRKCWAVAKKDIQVYYRKGPVIIFGVLFPVFLFLAFAIGRDMPPQNLAPGLIGMALFFTASATTPTVFPFETRTRTLERLLASPLHLSTLIAGDVLAAFLFGMVLSLLPVAISLTALGAELHHPLILIAAVLASGLCFSVLGTLLSTPATDDPASIMTLANLVRLPLIFVSGVFLPIREMPEWGSILSRISPLTYTTEALRHALGQETSIGPGISLAMIVVFLCLFWFSALILHKQNIGKRLWT